MQSFRDECRAVAGNRLFVLALAALIWAVLIFCRLIHLQVVHYSEYKALADSQQQRHVTLEAARGAICDRTGKPLAISIPLDSVCINPLRVPDRQLAAELLARVLGGVDAKELLEKMNAAVARAEVAKTRGERPKGVGFLWVKRRIPPEESDRLRSLKLQWVEFRQDTQRSYPDGVLASHVLGSVDFDGRGNAGIEQRLDAALRGKAGKARVVADVRHRGIESVEAAPAEPGKNLTLTIDERIQFVVERELAAACELYHAASGSVVVMNPHNGEILGMASYPTFDPNQPPRPGDDPAIRFNHPVSVAFEPGSVFKIITLSAALETTDLRPETPINCGGGTLRIGYRVIHEAKRGFSMLTMADVLAKSSNIGAIQCALRVGKEKMLEYVRRFGFGAKTGIPLPAESTGLLRELKWWGSTSIASIAMGHEVSTTTLQLAQATSVIANGGVLIRPRLILARQRPGGKLETEPAPAAKRILKPETAITMRQMMEGVVLHGTGKAARLAGYTSGGKTGSAQIFDTVNKVYTHLYNGSFAGFAPVTNPAVVIVVSLNGVHRFGGVVAAPAFKTIATETLRILEVPKDLPEDLPEPPIDPNELNDLAIAEGSVPPADLPAVVPRPDAPPPPAPEYQAPVPAGIAAAAAGVAPTPAAAASLAEVRPWSRFGPLAGARGSTSVQAAPGAEPRPQGSGRDEQAAAPVVAMGPRVPSFQGKPMRAVLEQSLALGVPVEVSGSGVARVQTPAAGAFLGPGERVRVEFQ